MLDRFVRGSVDRISPEAPIPVLRVERQGTVLGGAANVAANVVDLGGRALLLSVVGDDRAGREVRRLTADRSGLEPHLLVSAARVTTVKTRFVASGQQLLRADDERNLP